MFEYDDTQDISITTLTAVYRPESVTPRLLPFADACKLFTEHVQAIKKDSVGMYSGAAYGATLYRNDSNVSGITAAVIDFDNESRDLDGKKLNKCSDNPSLPEDHFDNLSGLTFFYHSTHSNTATWPKWRLIIPLDRPATLQECPFVVNGIIELLGGMDSNIDATCFELSRAFYIPSYHPEHKGAAFSGYSDGGEVKRVC